MYQARSKELQDDYNERKGLDADKLQSYKTQVADLEDDAENNEEELAQTEGERDDALAAYRDVVALRDAVQEDLDVALGELETATEGMSDAVTALEAVQAEQGPVGNEMIQVISAHIGDVRAKARNDVAAAGRDDPWGHHAQRDQLRGPVHRRTSVPDAEESHQPRAGLGMVDRNDHGEHRLVLATVRARDGGGTTKPDAFAEHQS